jgi:hypothetical protein
VSQTQCPVCFAPLEVRDVTPCFICGGWQPMTERLDPQAKFRAWRLPSGETLVLCHGCELEDFMVKGGWGYRLGLRAKPLPLNDLQFLKVISMHASVKDKYCPQCKLPLAFLKIVAASMENPEK